MLYAYAYIASRTPVCVLLQPRDYINSHQLFISLGLRAFIAKGLGGRPDRRGHPRACPLAGREALLAIRAARAGTAKGAGEPVQP